MAILMPNIKRLRDDLKSNGWHMTSFLFQFKGFEYIVLFEDLDNLGLSKGYYTVLLTFIDRNDESRRLKTKANQSSFAVSAKEFRKFFRIAFSENLGDILKQFYEYFSAFVPSKVNVHPTNQETDLALQCLGERDRDNNRCCFCLRRNPVVAGKQQHRTVFNGEKCRRLKPDLYEFFKDDRTISFCFRLENELPTSLIMSNFAKTGGC